MRTSMLAFVSILATDKAQSYNYPALFIVTSWFLGSKCAFPPKLVTVSKNASVYCMRTSILAFVSILATDKAQSYNYPALFTVTSWFLGFECVYMSTTIQCVKKTQASDCMRISCGREGTAVSPVLFKVTSDSRTMRTTAPWKFRRRSISGLFESLFIQAACASRTIWISQWGSLTNAGIHVRGNTHRVTEGRKRDVLECLDLRVHLVDMTCFAILVQKGRFDWMFVEAYSNRTATWISRRWAQSHKMCTPHPHAPRSHSSTEDTEKQHNVTRLMMQ